MSRSPREFDEEEDEDLVDGPVRRDREISLGTTTLLGIFFALALLCAVFFGFGYSLGSSHHTDAATPAASTDASSPDFNSFKKPSPGSTLNQSPNYPTPQITGSGNSPGTYNPNSVIVKADAAPGSSAKPAYDPDANIVTSVKPSASQPNVSPAPNATPAPPPPAPKPPVQAAPQTQTSFMVQVAAVTHQEDADLLVSTLQRRGYAVAIHSMPGDNLMHVQVGPFAQRKDAEAMRQRLLADGFNAILK